MEKVRFWLESKKIESKQIPWCPEGLWIDSCINLDTIEHQLGYYYIQGASSMVPSLILGPQPGDEVLDLCAAPGSKTTHIAQMMQNKGFLAANEGSFVRVRALVINIQRSGATNIVVTCRDGVGYEKFSERFNKVMLDAPCSDIGTARKNPRVLGMWNMGRVKRLSSLQKKLLLSAYRCLKDGGTLVYSTCTTPLEENEFVVEHLLQREDSASLGDINVPNLRVRKGLTPETRKCIRIMPQDNDSEAYFIAKVVKNA